MTKRCAEISVGMHLIDMMFMRSQWKLKYYCSLKEPVKKTDEQATKSDLNLSMCYLDKLYTKLFSFHVGSLLTRMLKFGVCQQTIARHKK